MDEERLDFGLMKDSDLEKYYVDSAPLTDEEFKKMLFYHNEGLPVDDLDFHQRTNDGSKYWVDD